MFSLYYVLILLWVQYEGYFCTSLCEEYEECASTTVSDDVIDCYGYESCYSSDLTCTDTCYCEGYFGCWHADIRSSDDTYCDGAYTCANAQISSDNWVYCDGECGCWINAINSSVRTQCTGDNSCRGNDIYNTDVVVHSGYLSGIKIYIQVV